MKAMSPQAATLGSVDWSKIPAPKDDGGAAHLLGMALPDVTLHATSGQRVQLGGLRGLGVLYIYPRTGEPDQPLPQGWDELPGARGCTPQTCAYRDHYVELQNLGVKNLYGISAQDTSYQREAVDRLHLPFALLSDEAGELRRQLQLPTLSAGKLLLLKRLTLIVRDATIIKVFYPVFPPDRDASNVMAALEAL